MGLSGGSIIIREKWKYWQSDQGIAQVSGISKHSFNIVASPAPEQDHFHHSTTLRYGH